MSTHREWSVKALAVRWTEAAHQVAERRRAHEIYSGNAWSHVRAARNMHPGFALYVASAGFGLIDADHMIPGYEATFSPGAERVADALRNSASAEAKHRDWWRTINDLFGHPRPFDRFQSARTIIAMGQHYMNSMEDELLELSKAVGPDGLLLINLGRHPLPPELEECRLPMSIWTELLANVVRSSVNHLAARWAIEQLARNETTDFESLRRIARELPKIPPRRFEDRTPIDDRGVASWIEIRLRQDPKLSRSVLLREFRAGGHRCEQARFAKLYFQVAEQMK